MLFNSIEYILFLIVLLPIYFLIKQKYRWIVLLVFSYFFYMCWNVTYILLILFTTAMNFTMSLLMDRAKNKAARTTCFLLALLTSLGLLFYFKYFNFALTIINGALALVKTDFVFNSVNILLPVGISFFTLQTLSYTIDVYTKKRGVEKHFGIFALYVSFFPQLVAGPIERSENLLPQFYETHKFSFERFKTGLYKMLVGYFMKMVIADRLSISVDMVYSDPSAYQGPLIVLATIAFAIQIYCDFAGYSLIAIGTAEILGYRLMQNFNAPYLAKSVREFWSRWHISLTTWLRDYIYIPMGGNRKGAARQYINILIVFAISGLWHGASFAFIIWGLLHAVYQIAERGMQTWTDKMSHSQRRVVRGAFNGFSHLSTLLLVVFAWIFFRAGTLASAVAVISNIFTATPVPFTQYGFLVSLYLSDEVVALGSIGLLFALEIINQKRNLVEWLSQKPLLCQYSFIVVAILTIVVFGVYGPTADNAFIYFQF